MLAVRRAVALLVVVRRVVVLAGEERAVVALLELDRVDAALARGVDERLRLLEVALVVVPDLRDDVRRAVPRDGLAVDDQLAHGAMVLGPGHGAPECVPVRLDVCACVARARRRSRCAHTRRGAEALAEPLGRRARSSAFRSASGSRAARARPSRRPPPHREGRRRRCDDRTTVRHRLARDHPVALATRGADDDRCPLVVRAEPRSGTNPPRPGRRRSGRRRRRRAACPRSPRAAPGRPSPPRGGRRRGRAAVVRLADLTGKSDTARDDANLARAEPRASSASLLGGQRTIRARRTSPGGSASGAQRKLDVVPQSWRTKGFVRRSPQRRGKPVRMDEVGAAALGAQPARTRRGRTAAGAASHGRR